MSRGEGGVLGAIGDVRAVINIFFVWFPGHKRNTRLHGD